MYWTVGDTIAGTYRVLRVHGNGGMGLVYQVRHLQWDVDLAVKSPRTEMFRTAADRERFIAEAQAWVSLGLHPHVCACHYVRVLDGVPLVFAEYLAGGSVREWIDDRRLYDGTTDEVLARIVDIAIQVAWGLGHAHEHGLVHQDVKPANVLLDADGTAKVTDFGIAKARASVSEHRQAPTDPTLSVLVSRGGLTPAYASPEQVDGGRLGRRTDVWSLAVSVLELFTGGISWSMGAAAPYALADHRQHGPPEPHLPPMPAPLHDLLTRCLRIDPADRPPTMMAVAEALVEIYERMLGRRYPRLAPRPAELRADELTNRALSLLDLGRPDEADRALAEALRVDPRHPHAVYNNGLLRWRRAEISDTEVVARIEEARVAGAGAVVDDLLTQIHLERGDPDPVAGGTVGRHDGAGSFEPSPSAAVIRPSAGGDYVIGSRPPGGGLDSPYTVLVWDVERNTARCELRGHPSRVNAADITADGQLAISGGGGLMFGARSGLDAEHFAVRVWDLVRGTCRHVLTGHTGPVRSVRVSADGRVAVTGSEDRTVRVWDLTTGSTGRVLAGHTDRVADVDVSADGRLAVSGGNDGTVRIWDLVSARTLRAHHHGHSVSAVALSADGHRVAFGDREGWLHVGDASTGSYRRIRADPTAVLTLDLNRDGSLAVTGGNDDSIRIWSTANGRCLRTCAGHRDHNSPSSYPVDMSATFTADGRSVLSAGRHSVRRWGLPTGHSAPLMPCRPRSQPELVQTEVQVRALLTDADRALDEQQYPAALTVLRRARATPGHERSRPVLDAWRRLTDRSVRVGLRSVWEAAPLTGHAGRVNAIAVSEEPDRAISAGADGTVRLWDLDSGQCLRSVAGRDETHQVAVSRDGRRVLFIRGAALYLWTGVSVEKVADDVLGPIQAEEQIGGPLAVSADGRYAITNSPQPGIILWDVTDGTRRIALPEQQFESLSLLLSADARFAVDYTLGDGTRLWDLEHGRQLGVLRPGHDYFPVALGPDGRLLLSDGWRLHLVDPFSGVAAAVLEERPGGFNHAQLGPDGRFAVSAGNDHTVRIWDLTTATCLRVLQTDARLGSVQFSADARFVLAGTDDGAILVWELDWELRAPNAADWHEDARPLLSNFLDLHTGDHSTWRPQDVDGLLGRLARAGLGWVRPEGVRAELLRMAEVWPGPPVLRMLPAPGPDADSGDPPSARSARTAAEARRDVQHSPCPRCGATPQRAGEPIETTPFGRRWVRIPGHCPACSAQFEHWFDLPR
ncbi:protein kinase domain-containing protein [Cryptosporangium minutisporangium]|uniref:Protein kinase domain-containing protein n=1 Tax=Cryptosporangium minutisporangium TaxID=113569 RepID=A0ABP6T110_9ACTN